MNWLRMPARDLGNSLESPNGVQGVGTTLLKKHKILPHPREDSIPAIYPSTPIAKPRVSIDTAISSVSSSDTSSPRTLKHASKRIGGLPPTPPTHSRQSSGNYAINNGAAAKQDVKIPSDIPSVPSTPPNQRSPPTPDVTPPRHMPLAFRPPVNDRYPSSRADSFKTALETQSDDEDGAATVRPNLPSTRTSAGEVPRASRKKRKEVGLGLGLESDNEDATTPKAIAGPSQPEFPVFDGEWGYESDQVEREWDDNLMRNVTVRKRPGRTLHMLTDGAMDEVIETDVVSPTQATRVVRKLPLQERINRHRKQRDTTEQRVSSDNFAERVPWQPNHVADLESPTAPDIRRFSEMSSRSVSSTVIEAMAVNAISSRRKTLRHTKKYVGLRDFSDQSTVGSAPDSVISSEPRQLLHRSAGRIPQQRHRSLASNVTISTTSSIGKSRRAILKDGGIPVVVIPDRQSSAKSSRAPSLRSTSSRKTKRSMSLNSAPLSASSKFNDPGYFDTLPPRKRTMSESAGSGDSIRTIDYPPTIPVRRSSLSAPTSRNNSRANSLTTESLKAHNMIQARKLERPSPNHAQSQNPTESHREFGSHSSRIVDHNGDPFFGKRLSTQVTPFSVASYETAGSNAEVSEAMAVSIFPHQNKSLLVIQHPSSELSQPTLKAVDNSQTVNSRSAPPTMVLNGESTAGPVTPPQPIHPMDEVDSPLRNPREPPVPPAIKFIPATPSGLTSGQEENKQLGFCMDERPTTSDEKQKRGLSLMRRAFSNRRNSEPVMSLGPGFFKRTFSLSNRPRRDQTDESTQTAGANANPTTLYPSVADRPQDGSKLHPFWRPSHFWDDLEDEGFADDELGRRCPPVNNRPGPPKRNLSTKLKRTFAILPVKDDYDYRVYSPERRTMRKSTSGNLRVVKQRSNSSLRREADNRRRYTAGPELKEGSFGYGFKEGNGGRFHTIPGLGLRVEYVGWGGLKRKLNEKRRQQRSEKLRASISNPRQVQNGVDDVLRRRSQQL